MKQYWAQVRSAFDLLWQNKVRSGLTMLGIAVGVASVILLVALGTGLDRFITQTFEGLGTNILYVLPGNFANSQSMISTGVNFSAGRFTMDDAKNIKKIGDPVVDVTAGSEEDLLISYRDQSYFGPVHAAENNYFAIRNIAVNSGREFGKADLQLKRKVAIIAPSLQEKLFGTEDPLGKKITVGDLRYEVIGTVEKKGASFGTDIDYHVYIPLSLSSNQFGTDRIMFMNVQVSGKNELAAASGMITRLLSKTYDEDEFSVLDQASLISAVTGIVNILTVVLGGIAAISLLVGGIGIMNVMLMSITERTKEIGLRKAVGARNRAIISQFLTEAVVLCLIGGLLGILIAYTGTMIGRRFVPTLIIPPWSVALAFGFSVVVGLGFGVYPAIKAGKLDPITALRYE